MKIDIDEVGTYDPVLQNAIMHCEIFLDGEKQPYCFAADEEAGTVLVAMRDESGALVRAGDHMARETKTGKVEIRFPAHLQWVKEKYK